jgi:hypothetical protein
MSSVTMSLNGHQPHQVTTTSIIQTQLSSGRTTVEPLLKNALVDLTTVATTSVVKTLSSGEPSSQEESTLTPTELTSTV